MSNLVGAVLVLGAAVCAATAHAGTPPGTFAGCPTGLQSPPPNYAATARHAAGLFLTTTYTQWNRQHHWGIKLEGAQVGAPVRTQKWLPSGWIKSECGVAAWQRSVAVPIRFPAMEYPNPKGPCDACAHTTFLLGDTAHGWKVWGSY
jgi:hypothetical protein